MKHGVCIQDLSCFGKCSLTIVLPVLSSAQVATSVLPTALLSTHTGGLGIPYHRDLEPDMKEIITHWSNLPFSVDFLYSGYVSSLAQVSHIHSLFLQYPNAMRVVDPVMGDHGTLYASLPDGLADAMREICKQADLITPNMTEAYALLREPFQEGPYDLEEITRIIHALYALTKAQIVLTGVYFDESKIGSACLQRSDEQIAFAWSEKILQDFHGTGDLFTASLLGALCNEFTLERAMELAVCYTTKCMKYSIHAAQEERYGVLFEPLLWKYGRACQEGEVSL